MTYAMGCSVDTASGQGCILINAHPTATTSLAIDNRKEYGLA